MDGACDDRFGEDNYYGDSQNLRMGTVERPSWKSIQVLPS